MTIAEKTITTKQVCAMAKHITGIIEGGTPSCSFRYLIYQVMGLDPSYYSYLYPEVQDLTNALMEIDNG